MSRRLRAIAQETVAAVDQGSYRTEQGGQVAIGDEVARAVAGTRLYLPGEPLPAPEPLADPPTIEVTEESSLAACHRLDGDRACLVFASARNPGGGFLNGAQAQEESIARASALYPCLRAAWDFYLAHRADPDLGYSDRVVYSPEVPVFRDDRGTPLAAPYPISFLTSAAPNLSAMRRNQPDRVGDVPAMLRRRAARVLAVAAGYRHRQLVLGAWGCGVFGNDPETVATAFAGALRESPWFERVVFAVLDRERGTPTLGAFQKVFR
ncbi:TIGR02452 family protein [Plantactinospora sp. KLBMP9567]|uniref:TIGR02452 family protein n=1 Tax=Plantactinospora sp. KLBMP9567 TaxID=3085900 RepID=UPI002980DE41|nr:TIGR02452 family protein [Plantactinospora sp. KLBMP9567]MDW5323360.1 TIGR02452 family protein [Plantactinospora sp. KLBMP9567]